MYDTVQGPFLKMADGDHSRIKSSNSDLLNKQGRELPRG